MSLPGISVCIATYNSQETIERCLRLVRKQDYPQSKVEIVLGDGGSTDRTLLIAKKYKAKLIKIPSEKQHAEYNRGVAFNKAKNELALIIDHDNFLPNKIWLKRMVAPFLENPDLVAATTLHYHYSKKYSLMDRYFALLGSSEPLPYFLKKADKMPQTISTWESYGKVTKLRSYFLVEFDSNPRKFPSIGSNGTIMRRELVLKNAIADPDHHYPIDVLFDVVKKGHNKFAFVRTDIIHLTHSRGLLDFIKRRKRFVEKYHFEESEKRRWSVVMKGDEARLALFIVYSITFVGPMLFSVRGFLKLKDGAWFIHPLMCLATTIIYGYVTIKFSLKRWM